jgi:hypothetical protein
MFLLSFLPDWIFYILLFLSGAGLFVATFLGKLPFIGTYAKAIQIGSAIVLVFSIYMCGGIANEAGWREKVLKQQAEIAQLKQKEAEVSTKVVTKYIDKITVVKEKNNEIAKFINQDADAKCQLPNSFSVLHDAAAKNELPDPARATDARASDIKLSEATSTIVSNYGACNQNTEQLKALQEWIREQQKLNP